MLRTNAPLTRYAHGIFTLFITALSSPTDDPAVAQVMVGIVVRCFIFCYSFVYSFIHIVLHLVLISDTLLNKAVSVKLIRNEWQLSMSNRPFAALCLKACGHKIF